MDVLLQVLEKEPVSLQALNPDVPKDLETVCLKSPQKNASRRYRTACELCEELDRYLRGEPVQARPVGRVERAWRWCKRKPALAGFIVTVLVLSLTLSVGAPLVALSQFRLREEADREREVARRHLWLFGIFAPNLRRFDAPVDKWWVILALIILWGRHAQELLGQPNSSEWYMNAFLVCALTYCIFFVWTKSVVKPKADTASNK